MSVFSLLKPKATAVVTKATAAAETIEPSQIPPAETFMGVYSNVLAPYSTGFWIVAVIGGILSFGSMCAYWLDETGKKKFKNHASLSVFTGLSTLLLLHLFGNQNILGWIYQTHEHSASEYLMPFGVVFWAIVLASVVVIFSAIRRENGVSATLALVGMLLLMQFVTGIPVLPWIVHHWPVALAILGGNLLIGILWAVFYKWAGHVHSQRKWYDSLRSDWLKVRNLPEGSELTLEDKHSWEVYFRQEGINEEGEKCEYRPRYRDHKSELLGWMMLWPVSMIETFLFDILSDFFGRVYSYLGGMFELVMQRRWKGTEDHMMTAEEKEIFNSKK